MYICQWYYSVEQIVLCGVRQVSILNPLIFLIYINDITNSITVIKLVRFADIRIKFFIDVSSSELFIKVVAH